MKKFNYYLFIFLLGAKVYAADFDVNEIEAKLQSFQESGVLRPSIHELNKRSINQLVRKKLEFRQKLMSRNHNKTGMDQENDPKTFGLRSIESNIHKMDMLNLFNGKVAVAPWSDDYWPIFKGSIAARYADPEFNKGTKFKDFNRYVERNEAQEVFETYDQQKINLLSPAEKYDLLIGGNDFTLTKTVWSETERYQDSNGDVEEWMGLCHGWAPASILGRRPQKKVEVTSFDGLHRITFYPSDLKALQTFQWANADFDSYFLGGRCQKKSGEIKSRNPDCDDVNPATWHHVITQLVGVEAKSFIMDATYDYEVWNQPINSYRYIYFNPITKKVSKTLNDAIIKIADFKDDRFKKYRHRDTRFVVGINMVVEYTVEVDPTQNDVESLSIDQTKKTEYLYDLELDSNYNIVGGEWYQAEHPDFIWRPKDNVRPFSASDRKLDKNSGWDGMSVMPDNLKEMANIEAKKSLLIFKALENLLDLSVNN